MQLGTSCLGRGRVASDVSFLTDNTQNIGSDYEAHLLCRVCKMHAVVEGGDEESFRNDRPLVRLHLQVRVCVSIISWSQRGIGTTG